MIIGSPTKLNLIPSGVMPVVYISQDDAGYDKQFLIYNGESPYNVPTGVSATIRGTKADGYGVTEAAELTVGSNLVTVTITEQMVAAAGENVYELVFVDTNGLRVASINMVWAVKPDALGGSVISDSDIDYATHVMNELQSVSAFKNQLDATTSGLAAEITNRKNADNAEALTRSNADVTLQNNINAEASARSTADASLQSQIDNLIAPSGGAPSAAEVTNARIDYDGAVFQTLGEATRATDSTIKTSFIKSGVTYVTDWIQGTIDTSGVNAGSSVRCRSTGYISGADLGLHGVSYILVKNGFKFGIREYTADVETVGQAAAFVASHVFTTNALRYAVDPTHVYRFIIGKTDDATLTPSDIPSDALSFYYYSPTDKTLTLADKAADSAHVGYEIENIQTAMFNKRIYASYDNSTNLIYQGGVNANTGGAFGSTNANYPVTQRTQGFYIYTSPCVIWIENALYKFRAVRYNGEISDTASTSNFVDSIMGDTGTNYTSNRLIVQPLPNCSRTTLRLSFARKDLAEMTADDMAAIAASLKIYKQATRPDYMERTGEYIRFNVNINLNWPDDTTTASTNAETENNVDLMCILSLPTTYSASDLNNPTPLIMFCHGASSQVTDDKWYTGSNSFYNFIRTFTNAGYAVFDVNNTRNRTGGFNDWGSLPLMAAYIKAWQYIKKHYNVSENLYLLSDSMGTAASLNMLKWYGSEVIAALQTAPRPMGCALRSTTVTDVNTLIRMYVAWGLAEDVALNATAYDSTATYAIGDYCVYSNALYRCTTAITTAESFDSSHWYQYQTSLFSQSKFKGFGQYEDMIEIGDNKYVMQHFPPLKVMVGTADTDFLTETRTYYQALKNFGTYVNYREVAGADHTDMSFLGIGQLRAEALAWFDRFRYQEPEAPDTPDDDNT